MMNELQFNFQPNQIFLSSPEHPNWLPFRGYMGLVPRDWSGERVQQNTHLLLNVKVKNMWNFTFIAPHAFTVCKRVMLLLQNITEVTQFCGTMLCSQIMVIKHMIYIHVCFYLLYLAWLADDQNQFIQCIGNLWTGLCIVSDWVKGLTRGSRYGCTAVPSALSLGYVWVRRKAMECGLEGLFLPRASVANHS